jgi:hypothetical protein
LVLIVKQYLLKQLLKPNGTTPTSGIEGAVLQSLYSILQSAEVVNSCQQDCRSLVVKMTSDASVKTLASPTNGINFCPSNSSYPVPLPPIDVTVNITLPQQSKLNEVLLYCMYRSKCSLVLTED